MEIVQFAFISIGLVCRSTEELPLEFCARSEKKPSSTPNTTWNYRPPKTISHKTMQEGAKSLNHPNNHHCSDRRRLIAPLQK